MESFKSFLIPIDGSASSERAALKAAALAQTTNATLFLLYAAELRNGPMPQHHIKEEDLPDDVKNTLKENGEIVLQRIFNKLPSDIQERTTCHVEVGPPRKVILEFAQKLSPDLIIMGTRGLNPAEAIVLGSVSQAMIESKICSVMMVH